MYHVWRGRSLVKMWVLKWNEEREGRTVLGRNFKGMMFAGQTESEDRGNSFIVTHRCTYFIISYPVNSNKALGKIVGKKFVFFVCSKIEIMSYTIVLFSVGLM